MRLIGCFVCLACSAGAFLVRADPPDSKVNTATSAIEITDAFWNGTNYDVRFTSDPLDPAEPSEETELTSNLIDDRRPRLALSPAGDSWVVWWRDGLVRQILTRKRDGSGNSWSPERLVSAPAEDSWNPSILNDGADTWVGYEFADAGQDKIVVGIITDEPDPFGDRFDFDVATYSGARDLRLHHRQGQLWVTWINDADDVGWSEFDYASRTWTVVGYENYSNASIRDARFSIQTTVTSN